MLTETAKSPQSTKTELYCPPLANNISIEIIDRFAGFIDPGFANEILSLAACLAQKHLGPKAKSYNYQELEMIFDGQIRKLQISGFEVANLLPQKSDILKKAADTVFWNWMTPFLPIPKADIARQLALINTHNENCPNNNDSHGVVDLDLSGISTGELNGFKAPDEPYYIFSVDSGLNMPKVSLKDSNKLLRISNRRYLTAEELVAFCFQNATSLDGTPIYALGSRCGDRDSRSLAVIYMGKDRWGRFDLSVEESINHHSIGVGFGIASCSL